MYNVPNENGRFGDFGGRFVPETLMLPLEEIEEELTKALADETFKAEYIRILQQYSGRPTPLTFAPNLTKLLNGAKIYLKREDLNHTGAHKINNAIGQALLAKRMGKKKLLPKRVQGSTESPLPP